MNVEVVHVVVLHFDIHNSLIDIRYLEIRILTYSIFSTPQYFSLFNC
jgi:hypothetical protein